ncbi:hypothetical protein AB0C77_06830 [Streptomyces sp. NPDC048629]|uniref:hypothetical protein n=1 Tax=Streptomyces sp. NPDC048629 TaxID=3154824 RepID=UPI003435835F
MSLHLPRLRGTGTHRSKTPAQLRQELDEATCHLVAMATEIDAHKAAERRLEDQLDAAGIELSGLRLDLDHAQQQNRALEARLANLTAVSSPAGERDIDPGDEPTQPVRVIPLHQAPLAT